MLSWNLGNLCVILLLNLRKKIGIMWSLDENIRTLSTYILFYHLFTKICEYSPFLNIGINVDLLMSVKIISLLQGHQMGIVVFVGATKRAKIYRVAIFAKHSMCALFIRRILYFCFVQVFLFGNLSCKYLCYFYSVHQ